MTATDPRGARRVLVTGANGYIGRLTVEALAADPRALERIVALDVRETPEAARRPGVVYLQGDVRGEAVVNACREHAVDTVVHLASIVTPGPRDDRATSFAVDVEGTQRVLGACVAA
ncbi:MAG: NAD-dependent epimerase/dehydratase family protein, partial [Myxococcales bacterium]|nr:NAD-dependent epimerase/dehydratase family protein [Myxococcales bacterium]